MEDKARLYSYYGGKHRMIKEILEFIFSAGSFEVYLELFFGSGATFFALPPESYKKAVVNDLDDGVAHLLKMLQSKETGEELLERLKNLQVNEIAFRYAKYEERHHFTQVDDMTKAVMVYQLISQSFNATRGSFRKGMGQERYTRQIISGLPLAIERLRGNVQIENCNALELIEAYKDEEKAFFFLDPPYMGSTRKEGARSVYKKEMSVYQHAVFLSALVQIKGKAMVCNYSNALYDDILLGAGWNRYELKETTKPSANRRNRFSQSATEIVWCNYDVASK